MLERPRRLMGVVVSRTAGLGLVCARLTLAPSGFGPEGRFPSLEEAKLTKVRDGVRGVPVLGR